MKAKNTLISSLLKGCLALVALTGRSSSASAQGSCYSSEGCSDYSNFGYNATTAATLEYDNYVCGFHSSAVRDIDGAIRVWGEQSKADGLNNWLTPTTINRGNYPGLTGTPLKIAIGSGSIDDVQFILLTSDNKLWVWGTPGIVLSTSLVATNAFQQLSIGLPSGVTAANVKMIFANWEGLLITTCDGFVYSINQYWGNTGDDAGTTDTWVKVQKGVSDGGGDLTGIVAARGGGESAYMALDTAGHLWTWGYYSWDGASTMAHRGAAKKMTLPSGATGNIKMIGISVDQAESTYYLLYENGNLYAVGDNSHRQLGNWTTTNSSTWVQPTYTSGGAAMSDIKWISPNEHSNSYTNINVINNDRKIYNWGDESGYDLGRGIQPSNGSWTAVNPGTPTLFEGTYTNNNIIAIESGGHTTMVLKECEANFGYVGHRVNGSMGDNDDADNTDNVYHFSTNAVNVCGAVTTDATLAVSVNGPYYNGNSVTFTGSPAGGIYFRDTSSTATATINTTTGVATLTSSGTLRVNYTVASSTTCPGGTTAKQLLNILPTVSLVTIPGTIWDDANEDAIKGSGENGLANNLWANLTDPNGNVIASVKVTINGTYAFQIGKSYLTVSGNYSVVLTNAARQAGDALTMADTLKNGYSYTGVNRGASGVDITNQTGKLNIGNLSIVAGGTTTNPVNFGIAGGTPLPISLIAFQALRADKMALLNWATATEQNNKGFDVERSIDGKSWNNIAFANSKAYSGNSTMKIDYTLTDYSPLPGKNFYRLKQNDNNGSFVYSQVSMVDFGIDNTATVTFHPNPVTSALIIDGIAAGTKLRVLDWTGRIVTNLSSGEDPVTRIDFSSLPAGLYVVEVVRPDIGRTIHKVIKQ